MKKITVICVFLFFLSLTVHSASAVQYGIDVLEDGNPGGWTVSLKTFDGKYTVDPCQQIELDIWITDVPDKAAAGGFWIDFTDSTDKISYVSAERYGIDLEPGPWTPGGVIVNKPTGTGTLLIQVINLGYIVPDADGDIIIAKVTLGCIGSGSANITVSVIPTVATWAPIPPWDDTDVGSGTITISFPSPPDTTTSISNSTTTSSTIPSGSTTTTLKPISTTTSTSLTTTTSKPILPCLVEEIYGKDSEETELLRNLRDTTLSRIPGGKEIINTYYKWNPLVVKAIEDDKEFREQVKKTIDVIISFLKAKRG